MTQANDSILVTPGTGATVATHTIGGKEHQVVMRANPAGHILGSIPCYSYQSGFIAAAANKIYMEIFNTDVTALVKLRKLFIQPNMAVNALAAQNWRLEKTSAIGTTGRTAITGRAHDSSNPAIPAGITAGHSATAGATSAFTFFDIFVSTEETMPGVHMAPWFNILPTDGDEIQDIILRTNEGIKLTNITGGAYTYNALAVVSIE